MRRWRLSRVCGSPLDNSSGTTHEVRCALAEQPHSLPGVPTLLPPAPSATTMPGSVQSLDTISNSSSDSYDEDEDDRLAEIEWQESLQQLRQLLSIVLLPYLGKWLGRRWSYWGTYKPPFYRCHIFTPIAHLSSDRITSLCPIRQTRARKVLLSRRASPLKRETHACPETTLAATCTNTVTSEVRPHDSFIGYPVR